MVWLHGGGFSTGSGSGARFSTAPASRRRSDVVVVTHQPPAERVRLHLPRRGEPDPDFALSGGAGMLDIVAALEWVRDNIDRFGGDPNLVTIFGQSGGGRKVATLMAMPGAKGLFHRAIIESGAVLRLTDAGRRGAVRPSCCSPSWDWQRGRPASCRTCRWRACSRPTRPCTTKMHAARAGHDRRTRRRSTARRFRAIPWDPAAPALSAAFRCSSAMRGPRRRSTTGRRRRSWRSTRPG